MKLHSATGFMSKGEKWRGGGGRGWVAFINNLISVHYFTCLIFSFLCSVLLIINCRYALFGLAIVLSVLLRITYSDNPFGIYKLFTILCQINDRKFSHSMSIWNIQMLIWEIKYSYLRFRHSYGSRRYICTNLK